MRPFVGSSPPPSGDTNALVQWCIQQIAGIARASHIQSPFDPMSATGVIGPGLLLVRLPLVNFNVANTDYPITLYLPKNSPYTRFRLNTICISHASQTLTTATVGVFTGAGATGTAIVTSGTAVTVSTGAENTNNNLQSLPLNNANTTSWNLFTLYFRVQTAEGAPATADVTITYQPLL